MKLGPISGVTLVGGGQLLRRLVLWAVSESIEVRVLTSPRLADERQGGGDTLGRFLTRLGVKHAVAANLEDASVTDLFEGTKNHFFLSLGAPWIFKEQDLARLFGGRLFNAHGTGLPNDRGGGGYSWRILMGKRFGFCTLHLVDAGVDTGPVAAIEEFLHTPRARVPQDFFEENQERYFPFITAFIDKYRLAEAEVFLETQPNWLATYWPRLSTDLQGLIDWSLSGQEIERFICAFDAPYSGASTFLGKKRVSLKSVSLSSQEESFHPYQSGLVFRRNDVWLCVAVPGATLVVQSVTSADGSDVLGGVKVGDRFFTPGSFLEVARDRVSYGPSGLRG